VVERHPEGVKGLPGCYSAGKPGRSAYCSARAHTHFHGMELDPHSSDMLVRSRELQRRSELVRRESAQLRCDSDVLRGDLAVLRAQMIRARDWGDFSR
jgi:hypothetical protein